MRKRTRPGSRALAGSVALHVVAFALLFAGVARPSPVPEFVTYRVDLVSAPPPTPAVEEAPRPAPRRPQPEPEPEPQPTPEETPAEPEPEPVPEREETPEPQPVDTAETEPSSPADTETTGSGAGEDALDLSLEGAEFAYPGYLENIITQIHRYFRWTGTSRPMAEVYFVINKDGSVGDIRLVRRSGNAAFDYEAIGAIEQAGRRRAFGPLPEGFPADRLPLRFEFRPPR